MSGGSYDYKFGSLEDLARDLERHSGTSKGLDKNSNDYQFYKFTSQFQPTRNRLAKALRKLAVQCRDVEWMDSGDTGEDGFKKVEKFLTKHNF